jgi:transcription elongation factor Elf1
MKTPIPSGDHPTRDQFVNNLLKHDINIDEYISIYKNSSIPPNNNLSQLTLEIFERGACFVNEYSKYQLQLNSIIQKHIENCLIEEVDGHFIVKNEDSFTCQFYNIENLVSDVQTQKIQAKRQCMNTTNKANKSTIQFKHTTADINNNFHDAIEKSREIEHHSLPETLHDERDADIAGKNNC